MSIAIKTVYRVALIGWPRSPLRKEAIANENR